MKKTNEIKKIVRQRYAKIAKENSSCCALTQSCCKTVSALDISKKIGYTEKEIRAVPKDANLSLGCGNPLAFASIKRGDVVLDLGSGAGLDVLLAARKVGMKGKVIGVDMTPEMIEKARTNAQKGGYKNVEFRLGEIENLPVADNSIDVIISNCVINLSPNKRKVFQEAFRVLKPGGKIIVADIMLEKELPTVIKNSVEGYLSCLSGATRKKKYVEIIKKCGFQDVTILEETTFPIESMVNEPTAQTRINKLVNSVLSVKISASKPLAVDKHR